MKKTTVLSVLGCLILGSFGCPSNNSPSQPGSQGESGSPTATLTKTSTPSGPTSTPTNTGTSTATRTVTSTPTSTRTLTATSTITNTPTSSATSTATLTATSTFTCSAPSGSFAPGTSTYGGLAGSYVVALPVTVTGSVRVTDFQLQGSNNSSSAPTSEGVGIYVDAGGKPGTSIALQSVSVLASAGNIGVTFTTPVLLNPGTYWLAADSSAGSTTGYAVSTIGGSGVIGLVYVVPLPSSFPTAYPMEGGGGTLPIMPCITADWECP